MKKLYSTLFWLILLVGIAVLTAAPVWADREGDWEYSVADGQATVTKYNGAAARVTVPATLGGKPVTGIGEDAFYFNDSLTELTLQEGVTSIGRGAFCYCNYLDRVILPASLKTVGEEAFNACTMLTRVDISDLDAWCAIVFADGTANPVAFSRSLCLNGMELTDLVIPEGVEAIKNYAFFNCATLRSVKIPSSVKAIGEYAFAELNELKTLTVPSSVKSIGDYAFYMSSLSEINLAMGVQTIGEGAFAGTHLERVMIPGSVTRIGKDAFDSYLTHIDIGDLAAWCAIDFEGNPFFDENIPSEHAPLLCYQGRALTALEIPAGVTHIGDYAFYCTDSLTSVTIPASVTSIGDFAFTNCRNLSSISISADNPAYRMIDGVLFDKDAATLIRAVTNKRLASFSIPNSVTRIESHAFFDCTGLTSITIPESVMSIGSAAFAGCNSLVSVGPSGSGCSIEYGWTDHIPDNAFSSSSIRYVAIPSSVSEIRNMAFSDCGMLRKVFYGGTQSQWSGVILYGGNDSLSDADRSYGYQKEMRPVLASGTCGNGTSYALDLTGCLTISGSGEVNYRFSDTDFYNCFNTVVIEPGVIGIGEWAFSLCEPVANVTLPTSLSSIGRYAFQSTSLMSVVIPGSVKSIGEGAFNACIGMRDVTISEGVTSIGREAFCQCHCMTVMTIPASVTYIGEHAFENCANLAAFEVSNDNPAYCAIDGVLFDKGVSTLTCFPIGKSEVSSSYTIPSGVTSIEAFAFWGCSGLTSLTIPASVTRIGEYAFSNCNGLRSAGPIGSACNIEFGWIYTIPSRCFTDCWTLTELTLPESVATIEEFAFAGCNLANVYYGGTQEKWKEIDIHENNESLITATIHFKAAPVPVSFVPADSSVTDTWINSAAYTSDKLTFTANNSAAVPVYLAAYDAKGRMVKICCAACVSGRYTLPVGADADKYEWKLMFVDAGTSAPLTCVYGLEFPS